MDWLRRNWPDLLIGVALVAVIAGIIATLISGGSFFPVGNRTAETPRSAPAVTGQPAPGQPGQPANVETEQAGQPGSQSGSTLTSTPAGSQQPPAVAVDPDGETGVVAGEPQEQPEPAAQTEEPAQSGASVEPLPADDRSNAQEASAPAGSSVTSTVSSSAPAQPQSPGAQVSSTPAPSTTSSPLPAAANSPEAPYRVSVGAFSSAENAQRQLEAFEAAGYPAFIGTQGNLNIVLVGPYDSEDEARSVASRISSSDLGVSDPTVYRFDPEETEEATTPPPASQSSTVASSAPETAANTTPATESTPAASAPAASNEQASAPANSSGRYLQVGAYGSRQSSLPQRERLEGMGFVVSDRVESDLVKLLVGPFDDGQMQEARQRLQAAGIESFPR